MACMALCSVGEGDVNVTQCAPAELRPTHAACALVLLPPQLNRTAPRTSQATLEELALPRKARIQQQVNHGLHDVTDFARCASTGSAQQSIVYNSNW
jgi:hypothetical protein